MFKKVVILILVLAVLLSGTYFAYTKFFRNNSVKLVLSSELEKFAVGKDADGFIIAKNDQEIIQALNDFNLPVDLSAFKEAIIIFKGMNSVSAALLFETDDAAESVKIFLDSQPNYLGQKIEIKDKVLVMESGQGFAGLDGRLNENPLFQYISNEHLDSNFLAFFDNRAIPQANFAPMILRSVMSASPQISNKVEEGKSILPTAEAALLQPGDNPVLYEPSEKDEALQALSVLSYSKMSGIVADLEDGVLNLTLTSRILQEDELADFMKDLGASEEEIASTVDEFYDDNLEEFKEALPELENMITSAPNIPEDFNASAELDGLTFSLTISVPFETLIEEFREKIEGSKNTADDAQKILNIQKAETDLVVVVLEGKPYPDVAMCIEDVEIFEISPKADSMEEKMNFGEVDCSIGFYQPIKGGVLLWTKVKNEENGNTNFDPDSAADLDSSELKFDDNSGKYYVVFVETGDKEENTVDEKVYR